MKIIMTRDAGGKAEGTVHVLSRFAAMNFIRSHAAKWLEDSPGETPFELGPRFRAEDPAKQMPLSNDRMMRGGFNR